MKKVFLVTASLVLVLEPTQSIAQDDDPPWEWSDEKIELSVNQVRAGRDLNPQHWPAAAQHADRAQHGGLVAVARHSFIDLCDVLPAREL